MGKVRPGEGERRAAGGLQAQYRAAARLILHHLRNGTLQWIRLADPEAGRVDDLQIGSESRIDAYQVKSSQYPGSFTFNNLIKPKPDAPNLLAQLAEGWITLRSRHTTRRVVVHLITNDIPSTSDQVPVADALPGPRHFAAFVKQAWQTAKQSTVSDVVQEAAEWKPAWERLQAASGLDSVEFDAFVQDCELEFGSQLADTSMPPSLDWGTTAHDVNDLAAFLFKMVASPVGIVELSRNDLLEHLGWQDRFASRSRHDFPVDLELYQPVSATVEQLDQALGRLPGGYIAVLGGPGTGKSTLLTQTLRGRSERVIS